MPPRGLEDRNLAIKIAEVRKTRPLLLVRLGNRAPRSNQVRRIVKPKE